MIHALFLIAMSTSLTSQFTLVREGEPFTLRVAKPALTRASFVVNVDPAGEEAERTPSSVEWYSSDGKKKGSAYALSKPNEIILGVLGNNTIQLTRPRFRHLCAQARWHFGSLCRLSQGDGYAP